MSGRPSDGLCCGYEALRAAATGPLICDTPRGLALFVAQGMAAWMRAFSARPSAGPIVPAVPRPVATGLGSEVVRVLTEMALGRRSELATS